MNHALFALLMRKILMTFKVTYNISSDQIYDVQVTTYDCLGTNIRILRLPYRLKKTRQQIPYVEKYVERSENMLKYQKIC